MKPRIRYGILDGFGEVIRWQWDRPASCYKFVRQRVRRDLPVIPFEEALV